MWQARTDIPQGCSGDVKPTGQTCGRLQLTKPRSIYQAHLRHAVQTIAWGAPK